MKTQKKIKVAVLRGGPSSEYDVSLKTGAGVLQNLGEKYEAIDILIDKKGVWHIHGVPFDPKHLDKRVDVAFIAMHGEYGEDGTVQRLLEQLHVPFTGSGSLASAIGMNKVLAKKHFINAGIKTPVHRVILKKDYNEDTAKDLWTTFMQPSVVKPVNAGSSVGVTLAYTLSDIQEGLEKAFKISDKVLIEELIKGKEATCGVLEGFRDKDHYALMTVEIVPQKHQKFFDYESKYSSESGAIEICPGNFTKAETEEIQRMAVEMHKSINAGQYSRSDFIVHPKRGVYALEINTLPGLTPNSLLPKEMQAVGSSYPELLDHLITLALKPKK
ncbi:MAG: D-alanine--D-alanine ligase [Candidatus Taylorbacteria bacterium]|nr:D-alanine--D-alanine ligase [Candidatus Taylorbacteria bacterium]